MMALFKKNISNITNQKKTIVNQPYDNVFQFRNELKMNN